MSFSSATSSNNKWLEYMSMIGVFIISIYALRVITVGGSYLHSDLLTAPEHLCVSKRVFTE